MISWSSTALTLGGNEGRTGQGTRFHRAWKPVPINQTVHVGHLACSSTNVNASWARNKCSSNPDSRRTEEPESHAYALCSWESLRGYYLSGKLFLPLILAGHCAEDLNQLPREDANGFIAPHHIALPSVPQMVHQMGLSPTSSIRFVAGMNASPPLLLNLPGCGLHKKDL